MQTVSSSFVNAVTANVQHPISYLEISWNDDIDVTDARGAANWTNETAYLVSHNGEISIDPPGENIVAAGDVGNLTVVLDNTSQRYSWKNTASPLTAYINTAVGLTGKPIRLWQGLKLGTEAELNGDFETDLSGWTASGSGDANRTTSDSYSGNASLLLHVDYLEGPDYKEYFTSDAISCSGGDPVRLAFYYRKLFAFTVDSLSFCGIQWLDSGDNVLDTNWYTVDLTSDEWQYISALRVAPFSASKFKIILTVQCSSNLLEGDDCSVFFDDLRATIENATTAEYVCIFTGIISDWTESTHEGQVTLTCRDWGFRFLQDKRSTALSYEKLPNEWTAVIATLAGITSTNLDVGIFAIPYCWMDDESIVEEIWQAWEADGGMAYFNQCGTLNCENALHWFASSNDIIRWTFNEGTYMNSDPEFNIDAIATKVVVEWSGRTEGATAVVYQLDSVRYIMPGETISWIARFQNATSEIFDPDYRDPYNDYWAETAAAQDITDKMTVSVSDVYAQQCKITVANTSPSALARLTFLQIRGHPLLGGPTGQESSVPIVLPYAFNRTRTFRGNPYLQTANQAAALASLKSIQCARIHPIWRINDVLGIPHLELGDKIHFVDARAQGNGNGIDAIVIGISWESSAERGFVQRITAFDIDSMMAYDYGEYFIIGEDTLGEYKRIYY